MEENQGYLSYLKSIINVSFVYYDHAMRNANFIQLI